VEEINRLLLETQNIAKIAEQYNVNYHALYRHKANHLPAEMVKAQEAREVANADTLLGQVGELRDKALSILDKAEQAGDLRTALQGVREAKGCLELLAKLQGELAQEGTVNVMITPQWLSLRAVILQALEPYPEARLTVARTLREAEGNVGS